MKKIPSKMASEKVEGKNPPRAQMFRYFRIESRNKNAHCGYLGSVKFL